MDDHASLIVQFKDITGLQDNEQVSAILAAHDWNLGRALNAAFEGTDVSEQAGVPVDHSDISGVASSVGLRRRIAKSAENEEDDTSISGREEPEEPEGGNGGYGVMGYIMRIAMLPIDLLQFIRHQILGRLLTFGWTFFASLFPGGLADNRPEDGEMLRELQEKFPNRFPKKVEGTMLEAANRAKRELKFLLIVLHNPVVQQSQRFIRETLCSDNFVSFSDSNLVLWAESAADKRGYTSVVQLMATQMPFLGLVTFVDGQMKMVWRRSGFMSTPALMEKLLGLIEQYQPALVAEEHERVQREMDRALRAQQDEEYEASLRRDREKMEEAAREKDRIEKEKTESQNKLELRAQELEAKLKALPQEPLEGELQVKLKFRFPNGTSHDRAFSPDTTLKQLYDFVDTRDSGISEDFSIYAHPRIFLENNSETLEYHGMRKGRAVLNVQDNSE